MRLMTNCRLRTGLWSLAALAVALTGCAAGGRGPGGAAGSGGDANTLHLA